MNCNLTMKNAKQCHQQIFNVHKNTIFTIKMIMIIMISLLNVLFEDNCSD